jgi:hypothetical protein
MDLLLRENRKSGKMRKFDVKMHHRPVFPGVSAVICLILSRHF